MSEESERSELQRYGEHPLLVAVQPVVDAVVIDVAGPDLFRLDVVLAQPHSQTAIIDWLALQVIPWGFRQVVQRIQDGGGGHYLGAEDSPQVTE